MFIYTVNPGDSLYSISQKYDVPIDVIRDVNGLVHSNLVPGQALLIRTNRYIVQPGDSFFTISDMAYLPTEAIIAANPGINPRNVQVGMSIMLPEPPEYIASTLNYFYITGTASDQVVISTFSLFTTYYSFFEYHFSSDGSLSSLNDLSAIESAWNNNTAPLATITNLTATGFSSELLSATMNNTSARQNLVDQIFTLVLQNGYAGVNIDFEEVLPNDRELFSTFLRELKDRFHNTGLLLTIALPPLTSGDIPWYQGYDYEVIGSIVDYVFIMAYNWHYRASEAGPVASIRKVRETIEYALTKMDREQIIVGVPLYGYNWILPYNPERLATTISNQDAVDLALRYQVPINYSVEDETPYFNYVDEAGQYHVVWFEDNRSLAAKIQLIREYNLLGIGSWQLGLGFIPGPWLLNHFLTIRKVT